jgi:hypothetical protein
MSRRLFVSALALLLAAPFISADQVADTPNVPACRNVFTVYIDFSETITGRAQKDEGAPLHNIAAALRHLLTSKNGLLRDGDAVSIVAFGQSAVELLRVDSIDDQSRSRLDAELAQFIGSEWRTSSLVGEKISDLSQFSRTTRLDSVLDSIEQRLAGSGSKDRHLVLIASDFAHDDDDSCNSEDHFAKFAKRFDPFVTKHHDTFVGSSDKSPPAQLMLLSVPPAERRRCGKADLVVAANVIAQWSALGAHHIRDLQSLSPEQLEAEIEERFSAAVRILSAKKIGQGEIALTVFNPNCTEAIVRAVKLQVPNAEPADIPLRQAIRLTRLHPSEEVMVQSPLFEQSSNQMVEISPIVGRFKTHGAVFWMGDTIHVGTVTPRLYPRFGVPGTILLLVEMDVNSDTVTDLKLHVVDMPVQQDAHFNNEITVAASTGGSRRTYVVPFTASPEVIQKIRGMPALTLKFDQPTGSGARVVTSSPNDHHPTEKPFVGVDGLFNKYLPIVAGAIGLIVLIWSRRYRVARAADAASLVYLLLAFFSWLISFFSIETWPFLARLLSIPSFGMWVAALGEAAAAGILTLSISRMYVLAIQWPRMMAGGMKVADAYSKRVRAEKIIIVVSGCVFVLTLILLLYSLPFAGIMVARKAS